MRVCDGPVSPLFTALPVSGNARLAQLAEAGISQEMIGALSSAPEGPCVGWGIPFEIGDVLCLRETVVSIELPPMQVGWLVLCTPQTCDPTNPAPMASSRRCGARGN